MKISLYEREGQLAVDSCLYDKGEITGEEYASGMLEVERGSVTLKVWVASLEECQALIDELEIIKEHLENQNQEAA